MQDNHIISQDIDNKTVLWFESSNEYLVVEKKTAAIINQLHQGISEDTICNKLSIDLDIPFEKTMDFIVELKETVYLPKLNKKEEFVDDYENVKKPDDWFSIKYYTIYGKSFKVKFENEELLSLIHPKFAYLESNVAVKNKNIFEVFKSNGYIFLYVDDLFVGAWSKKEAHFFQGKFSMELIQKIYHTSENDWLGIFHASAVAKNEKSILFLGDSGNGKSTSLALLQANGLTCLADDFVPFSAENLHVYSFPSAISIKKNSVAVLLPHYPTLKSLAEYEIKGVNKVVRYLPPSQSKVSRHMICKDLVFIKYKEGSNFMFKQISKTTAFEKLVPDSWISPLRENVSRFLDWYSSVNCYELIYSNNQEMLEKVEELFSDEL